MLYQVHLADQLNHIMLYQVHLADQLNHIMLYRVHLSMSELFTTLLVKGTDWTGSCKSKFHVITTMMAPTNQVCSFESIKYTTHDWSMDDYQLTIVLNSNYKTNIWYRLTGRILMVNGQTFKCKVELKPWTTCFNKN
jgi:hypothetical protein